MVINYSRRRRGESGATLPNDVQREIEDLAALINIVGGLPTCMASSLGPRWRCGQLRPECRSHLPWLRRAPDPRIHPAAGRTGEP
jgi:hypothetical protein